MLTLTITTSTKLASLSLFDKNKLLASINVNVKKTHSSNILEQLDSLFIWSNRNINEVKNVIISTGPGSFTGVRIAMSLIKGIFCLSPDVKIYTVNELEALYYQFKGYADIIICGIDSRKGKIYYTIHKNNKLIQKEKVGNIYNLIEEFKENKSSIIFVGDILEAYEDDIIKVSNLVSIPSYEALINSNTFYTMYVNNLLYETNINELVPNYLEPSQAEKDYKGE